MDSPVALALMTKAQAVFDNDNVFLSFPLVPLPFTKEKLSFMTGDAVRGASLNGLAEFTRMVNLAPGVLLWLPTGGPYLWEVYTDVLASAQLAQSNRTADEEIAYQAAFKYLHILHDDGTWEDTPQVKAYNQYRNASLALQQNYNNHKMAADLSTDPAVKQQWHDIDEPAFQTQMQTLLTDWINNGYKQQVEDARSTFARLGARSPGQIWEQWQSQCNPHIDTITDTNNQSVFITGFSPSSIIDEPTWQRFTLTSDEVTQLIDSAAPELKDRLAPDAIDLEIDTLSFEYASVSLSRPWLQTDLFNAHFWRLNDGDTPISDGQYPPQGRYPAYVVAVVFARNIEIRLKAQSSVNAAALQRLHAANKSLSLGAFTLSASSEMTSALKQPVLLSRPVLEPAPIPPEEITAVRPIAAAHPIEVQPSIIAKPITTIRPSEIVTVRASDNISPGLLKQSDNASMLLKRTDYIHLPPIFWGPPHPPPPPPPPTVIPDDSIYVLTFICKVLPTSPDPDPTLKW